MLDQHAHTLGIEVRSPPGQVAVLVMHHAKNGEHERIGRQLAQTPDAIFGLLEQLDQRPDEAGGAFFSGFARSVDPAAHGPVPVVHELSDLLLVQWLDVELAEGRPQIHPALIALVAAGHEKEVIRSVGQRLLDRAADVDAGLFIHYFVEAVKDPQQASASEQVRAGIGQVRRNGSGGDAVGDKGLQSFGEVMLGEVSEPEEYRQSAGGQTESFRKVGFLEHAPAELAGASGLARAGIAQQQHAA